MRQASRKESQEREGTEKAGLGKVEYRLISLISEEPPLRALLSILD